MTHERSSGDHNPTLPLQIHPLLAIDSQYVLTNKLSAIVLLHTRELRRQFVPPLRDTTIHATLQHVMSLSNLLERGDMGAVVS